jgi:hypothetical protein
MRRPQYCSRSRVEATVPRHCGILSAVTQASGIQWGNVPAWVGGILTSLSLLLAFYIILRDRRKEESEQARRIITSSTLLMGSGMDDQETLYVENASDRPIRLPTFIADGRPVYRVLKDLRKAKADEELIMRLEEMDVIGSLSEQNWLSGPIMEMRPGERREFTIVFNDGLPRLCYQPDFSFVDANGQYWRRYIHGRHGPTISGTKLSRWPRWRQLKSWYQLRRARIGRWFRRSMKLLRQRLASIQSKTREVYKGLWRRKPPKHS